MRTRTSRPPSAARTQQLADGRQAGDRLRRLRVRGQQRRERRRRLEAERDRARLDDVKLRAADDNGAALLRLLAHLARVRSRVAGELQLRPPERLPEHRVDLLQADDVGVHPQQLVEQRRQTVGRRRERGVAERVNAARIVPVVAVRVGEQVVREHARAARPRRVVALEAGEPSGDDGRGGSRRTAGSSSVWPRRAASASSADAPCGGGGTARTELRADAAAGRNKIPPDHDRLPRRRRLGAPLPNEADGVGVAARRRQLREERQPDKRRDGQVELEHPADNTTRASRRRGRQVAAAYASPPASASIVAPDASRCTALPPAASRASDLASGSAARSSLRSLGACRHNLLQR